MRGKQFITVVGHLHQLVLLDLFWFVELNNLRTIAGILQFADSCNEKGHSSICKPLYSCHFVMINIGSTVVTMFWITMVSTHLAFVTLFTVILSIKSYILLLFDGKFFSQLFSSFFCCRLNFIVYCLALMIRDCCRAVTSAQRKAADGSFAGKKVNMKFLHLWLAMQTTGEYVYLLASEFYLVAKQADIQLKSFIAILMFSIAYANIPSPSSYMFPICN